MTEISGELLRRIAERARDPLRRTFMAGARTKAQPLDFGALVGGLSGSTSCATQGLIGAVGKMESLLGGRMPNVVGAARGGMMTLSGSPAGPQPLPAPPGEDRLREAEAALGRSLPTEIRQLYEIADGGFGPGDGLMPISEVVDRYRTMTGAPFGPLGQPWPATLLPLFDEDPVLVSLDLESGKIVAWDPEEIENENSEESWRRSFKVEFPTLAALMTKWLGEATFEDQAREARAAAELQRTARGASPVTGHPMQLDPAAQAAAEIVYLGGDDASLRAEYGLPETGWEDEIRRRHGLL